MFLKALFTIQLSFKCSEIFKIPAKISSVLYKNLKRKLKKNTNNLNISKEKLFDLLINDRNLVNEIIVWKKSLENFNISISSIEVYYDKLVIGGRYNKYKRGYSQSSWTYKKNNNNDEPIESIEDIILSALKKSIPAKKYNFISSGREDIDVLMLGNGRPFAFEIYQSFVDYSTIDCVFVENLINSINPFIKVHALTLINNNQLNMLKESDKNKRKLYRARFELKSSLLKEKIDKINSIKILEIRQKTPIRVIHRRPNLTRYRFIYDLRIENTNSNVVYDIFITTDAGTYVKEFIHSDFGRTNPSLSDLLDEKFVDFIELDVQNIEFEWP